MAQAGRRTEQARARAERRQFRAERIAGRAQARRIENSRSLWASQRTFLAVCFFFTTVFLVFVTIVASNFAGNHTWSLGEVTVYLVILLVSPVLAWATGFQAHLMERRAVTKSLTADWLPPATDELDLDRQTTRLRRLAPRAAFVGLLWTAVLGFAVWISTIEDTATERLLETGLWATGTVQAVNGRVGPSYLVHYSTPAGDRSTTIRSETGGSRYSHGAHVTIIYDPADPERVRTYEDPNEDEDPAALGLVLGIAAGVGVLMSLPSTLSWQRRYRSVRKTGWRSAEATVSATIEGGMPSISVRFTDDSQIMMRAALSLNDAWRMAGPARQVWIGGTDERMVVLYPHGRWRSKPYAVPARGRKPRDPGPRR